MHIVQYSHGDTWWGDQILLTLSHSQAMTSNGQAGSFWGCACDRPIESHGHVLTATSSLLYSVRILWSLLESVLKLHLLLGLTHRAQTLVSSSEILVPSSEILNHFGKWRFPEALSWNSQQVVFPVLSTIPMLACPSIFPPPGTTEVWHFTFTNMGHLFLKYTRVILAAC